MSKTKLCPMRKDVEISRMGLEGLATGQQEDFLPCIQEKCAWWVEQKEVHVSGTALLSPGTITVPGHCVALGWGKK